MAFLFFPPAVEALRAYQRQKPAWTNKPQTPSPQSRLPLTFPILYWMTTLVAKRTKWARGSSLAGDIWLWQGCYYKRTTFDWKGHIKKRALLSDGYSRVWMIRTSEIRLGDSCSTQGTLLSFKTYKKHAKEVVFAARRSIPYRRIMDAISDSKLILERERRH